MPAPLALVVNLLSSREDKGHAETYVTAVAGARAARSVLAQDAWAAAAEADEC